MLLSLPVRAAPVKTKLSVHGAARGGPELSPCMVPEGRRMVEEVSWGLGKELGWSSGEHSLPC